MNKIYVYSLLLAFVLFSCQNQNRILETSQVVTIESILKNISEPVIPDFSLNVKDFGAIGDSISNTKTAFDKAIKALNEKGGGKLIIPEGKYLLNGPIHLTSNMDLHLETGATLLFGSNPEDYLPVVKTSWEGTFLFNYSPFIYALECTNVAITGEGTINGLASKTWTLWHGKQGSDQLLSREMNHKNVPLEERIFGAGHVTEISGIHFENITCKKATGTGIVIQGFPEKKISDVYFTNIRIDSVKNAISMTDTENIILSNLVIGELATAPSSAN